MSDPLFASHPRYAGLFESGFQGKRPEFVVPEPVDPLALFAASLLASAGLVIGGIAAIVAFARWIAG